MDRYIGLIEEGLQRLPFDQDPKSLYEPCRYLLDNGGKRVRPVMTLMASGLCGGSVERALPAALSVELIHNFTLVHDDIMDQAVSRRGKATIHEKWDEPTAILVGDILYTEGFHQLLSYADEPGSGRGLVSRLYGTLLNAVRTVCEGQAMDLDLEKAERANSSDYMVMIEGKTSGLISCSLAMGGIVAAVDDEKIGWLKELGRRVGVAFQIQDDLMDVIADPEKFGKRRGGDILEGKKTFLLLHALEDGNQMERNELYRLMALPNMGQEEIQSVIDLFEETGAVENAKQSLSENYRQAIELLNRFDDSDYKEDLNSLMNFLIDREY